MPAMYEIRFGPEGPTKLFAGSRGNYYEFEDGSHIDVYTTPVWCHDCGKITHGEQIELLEEIDKQLADLDDPNSQLYQLSQVSILPPELEDLMPKETFRLDLIGKAKKRREWRERRISPPKCIRCGSTNIFVFPIDQPVPNPAGPGTVEVRSIGMCSTDFNEWFFTPEGDRIPRETTPTHWQHPDLDNSPEALQRLQRFLESKKLLHSSNRKK